MPPPRLEILKRIVALGGFFPRQGIEQGAVGFFLKGTALGEHVIELFSEAVGHFLTRLLFAQPQREQAIQGLANVRRLRRLQLFVDCLHQAVENFGHEKKC